jgi:hypothetical protein
VIRDVELWTADDWSLVRATPLAGPTRNVTYWYFDQVLRFTNQVGVAEAEKPAAAGQGAH